MADLRSASAEADRSSRRRSCGSEPPSIRSPTRSICAAATSSMTGHLTASGSHSSTSSGRSNTTRPMPPPTLGSAMRSARWRITGSCRRRKASRAPAPLLSEPSRSIPISPRRYGTLALGSLFHRRNWDDAVQQFERSIALNPRLASVRAFHAILLATLGRHDDVDRRGPRRARARSALTAREHECRLGVLLRRSGGADDRGAAANQDLHQGQNADEVHGLLMASYEQMGRLEEAARQPATACHACFGVPIDTEALLAAWRTVDPSVLAASASPPIDRVAAALLPMAHYNYAVVMARLGRTTRPWRT